MAKRLTPQEATSALLKVFSRPTWFSDLTRNHVNRRLVKDNFGHEIIKVRKKKVENAV